MIKQAGRIGGGWVLLVVLRILQDWTGVLWGRGKHWEVTRLMSSSQEPGIGLGGVMPALKKNMWSLPAQVKALHYCTQQCPQLECWHVHTIPRVGRDRPDKGKAARLLLFDQ